jgi:isoleucyl-tRNA synthetase
VSGIISEELNVKDVIFRDNEEDLVEYSAKANFKVLGKELGPNMKTAAGAIEGLKANEIQSLLEGATLSLDLSFGTLEITEDSVVIQRSEKANMKVLNEGSLTIALDAEMTEELLQEGMVRDIVRSVQNLRKDRDLDVTDRIILSISGSDRVKAAVVAFQDYLTAETLTEKWNWEEGRDTQKVECGEEECVIALEKV